jgi:hypothetical protein
MLLASMAPSAAPAPTSVCSSSMNRMTVLVLLDLVHDRLEALLELPRYLVPAITAAMSRASTR